MTSLIAAGGSGRSVSVIPAVPAVWSVTTIAFNPHLLVSGHCPRCLCSPPVTGRFVHVSTRARCLVASFLVIAAAFAGAIGADYGVTHIGERVTVQPGRLA